MVVGSKIKKIILCRGLGSRDAYSSCPSILRLWVRIPLGEETKINETKTGEAQTFKNYWCLHSRNCLYHFSPSKDGMLSLLFKYDLIFFCKLHISDSSTAWY